jgi:hypothetical protein
MADHAHAEDHAHGEDHAHDPAHGDGHEHPHADGQGHDGGVGTGGEQLPPPSQSGSVVLDLGGQIGAAVVYTPLDLLGSEIEIRPAGGQWTGAHTAVRERHAPDGVVAAALFEKLPAGTYELRLRPPIDDAPAARIEVTGGRVAQTRWSAAESSG